MTLSNSYFSQLSMEIDELIRRIYGRDIQINKLQEESMTLWSDIKQLEGRLEDVEANRGLVRGWRRV